MNADSAAWGNIFRHVKFNRAVAVPASHLSHKAFLPPFRMTPYGLPHNGNRFSE